MGRRGGFQGGGMPGNMNNLMKQAQRMQRQMEEQAKAMEEKSYEATAGGGAVKVVVSGTKEVTEVHIDPDIVDPEDTETLEDAILVAVNQAFAALEEDQSAQMSKITGNMGGLGGLPF